MGAGEKRLRSTVLTYHNDIQVLVHSDPLLDARYFEFDATNRHEYG